MWPALLVIAASMFAKHMANKQAQERQNQLQNAMQTYQRGKAQENEQAINQLTAEQTPAKRAAELEALQAARTQSMTGTVDAARAASPVTVPAGATSSDYQKASSTAADTVAARAKRAIEQMGTMGAPGEAGVAQGMRFGRAAGKVDAGNTAIGNVGNAYMGAINNVRPDPWLTMAGDVGMGVGGYMLGGAGSAAGTGRDVVAYGGAGDVASAPSASGYGSAAGAANGYTNYASAARRARMNSAFANWGR